jgi:hypothetical protein
MVDSAEPFNPETGKPLSDLDRAPFRLNLLMTELTLVMRGLRGVTAIPPGNPFAHEPRFLIDNVGMLVLAKFLEILASLENQRTDRRLAEVLKAIAPITARIRIWPSIESFRDQVHTHAYRTATGSIVNPAYLIASGEVPGTSAEVAVLISLTQFAVVVLLEAFFDEYWAILPLVNVDDPSPSSVGVSDGTQVEQEVHRVINEVTPLITGLGVNPFGRVFQHAFRQQGPSSVTPSMPEWAERRARQRKDGTPVPKPAPVPLEGQLP